METVEAAVQPWLESGSHPLSVSLVSVAASFMLIHHHSIILQHLLKPVCTAYILHTFKLVKELRKIT